MTTITHSAGAFGLVGADPAKRDYTVPKIRKCAKPEDYAPPLDPDLTEELYAFELADIRARAKQLSSWDVVFKGRDSMEGTIDEQKRALLLFGQTMYDIKDQRQVWDDAYQATPWWRWRRRRWLRYKRKVCDAMITQIHGLTWVYY